ncbi:NAD(P)-dependent oxidoreductase [Candidatus Poriferisocius sp.]|uniref:NAD(P)-dependent oxidoreductase n=1 Tax=Candidatus Poriferisocius sp. TaxID=3101276 RepID=UPI003B5B2C44
MTGSNTKIRIWIDRTPPPGVEIPSDVELVDGPEHADGVVVAADRPWDDDACRRLPQLKVVARSGIGYDNVDVAACASHGVAACNTPDAPTVSTAEHALALMLAVTKRLKGSEARLAAGTAGGPGRLTGPGALELDGRTLGLVGCGRIGSLLGRYAEAMGMTVLVYDPYLDAAPMGRLVELDQLWAESDVVSLHAPATAETHHIVNTGSLAAMRPGVVIINCARGALVDQEALLAALDSGRVAGAGLDVTEPEPLPPDHPLLGRDNVFVTPHVASTTTVGIVRLVGQALEQALIWLRGGTPEHLLDPAAAHPAVDRRIAHADTPHAS